MADLPREPRISDATAVSQAIDSLRAVLGQVETVLQTLEATQYTRKPVGGYDASVGGHVRHCLDHVATLLASARSGDCPYDQRRRGTDVETDRDVALQTIRRCRESLGAMTALPADQPLHITTTIGADGREVRARSSVLREVVFVLSHTIHHNAIIAAMVRSMGRTVPDRFGYAPSTIHYLDE